MPALSFSVNLQKKLNVMGKFKSFSKNGNEVAFGTIGDSSTSGGYFFESRTVTSKDHRAAYSTDGDYFSNPNAEDVFDAVYNMMHDYNPSKYPKMF